jgi:hypothetical protein
MSGPSICCYRRKQIIEINAVALLSKGGCFISKPEKIRKLRQPRAFGRWIGGKRRWIKRKSD